MSYFAHVGYKDVDGVAHGYIDDNGSPQICAQPYLQALAEGDVSGHTVWTKNGYNEALSATEETIWTVGGDYVYPSEPMQMEVVSSSTNDTSAGTGARTVTLYYLDDNYEEQTEIITLNGTNEVLTTATNILRVNDFRVKTTGTGNKNAGNIDVRNTANTPIYSRIATGINKSTDCLYTVPAGKVLYVFNLLFSAAGNVANRPVRFISKTNYDTLAGTVGNIYFPLSNVICVDSTIDVPLECPTKFPATADVKINGISPDGATYGAAIARGWLENV